MTCQTIVGLKGNLLRDEMRASLDRKISAIFSIYIPYSSYTPLPLGSSEKGVFLLTAAKCNAQHLWILRPRSSPPTHFNHYFTKYNEGSIFISHIRKILRIHSVDHTTDFQYFEY